MMDNGGSAMDEDDPLTTTQSSTKSHVKIASNYSVDPAKFYFLLTRLVLIEKISEYGTEFCCCCLIIYFEYKFFQ